MLYRIDLIRSRLLVLTGCILRDQYPTPDGKCSQSVRVAERHCQIYDRIQYICTLHIYGLFDTLSRQRSTSCQFLSVKSQRLDNVHGHETGTE
jgi:hypothetical protein